MRGMTIIHEPAFVSSSTTPHLSRPRSVPMGPPWWGAVMGTGIIGTLTQLHAGDTSVGAGIARFFLIVGWVLMLSFSVAFITRCIQDLEVWRSSISGVGAAAWGMVSMGTLAVGAATATVLPSWIPDTTTAAWNIDEILWTLGTAVGLLSTFGFTLALIRQRPAQPRPAWGLAIVPPMVSATCGAPFVARIESPVAAFALLVFLVACFVCSLTLGVVIFSAAYHHHLRIDPIPAALATSSWIPLGVVGQSTAAAQAIAGQAARFLSAEAVRSAHLVANFYGCVMLTVAIPLVAFAIYTTVRGAVNRMPFSPGWWALTFPIGTLSLGALSLGESSRLAGYSTASVIAWMILLCTWTLCSVSSLLSLRTRTE